MWDPESSAGAGGWGRLEMQGAQESHPLCEIFLEFIPKVIRRFKKKRVLPQTTVFDKCKRIPGQNLGV